MWVHVTWRGVIELLWWAVLAWVSWRLFVDSWRGRLPRG